MIIQKATNKSPGEFLFTGRRGPETSMTTRHYARLFSDRIGSVGLDPRRFGTHSLRRTKATLIYRRIGNSGLSSFCLATSRLKARLDISASR
jgi:integrase